MAKEDFKSSECPKAYTYGRSNQAGLATTKGFTADLPSMTKTLVIFIKVAYYTLLCPFKLEYNTDTGVLTPVRAAGCQKHMLLALWVVGEAIKVFLLLPTLQSNEYWAALDSLSCVLIILGGVSWAAISVIFKAELWWGHEKIAAMLNLILELERNNCFRTTCWLFKYPAFLAAFVHLQMLAMNLWEIEIAFSRGNESTWDLLLGRNSTSTGFGARIAANNILTTVLEYENQIAAFGGILLWMLSLTVFAIAWSLRTGLKSMGSGQDVSRGCELLLQLSTAIKESLGGALFAYNFMMLPYFTATHQGLYGDSISDDIQYSYHMLRYVFTLLLGAEAHAQLNGLAESINSIGTDDTVSKPTGRDIVGVRRKALLLDAMHRNAFGLRSRYFTVTYTLFGCIMGTILAYSISVVQLRPLRSVRNAGECNNM